MISFELTSLALALSWAAVWVAISLCALGAAVALIPRLSGALAVFGLALAIIALPALPVVIFALGVLGLSLVTSASAQTITLGTCFGLAAGGAGYLVFQVLLVNDLPQAVTVLALGTILSSIYLGGTVGGERPALLGMALFGFISVLFAFFLGSPVTGGETALSKNDRFLGENIYEPSFI
jgi:hypothetical protein